MLPKHKDWIFYVVLSTECTKCRRRNFSCFLLAEFIYWLKFSWKRSNSLHCKLRHKSKCKMMKIKYGNGKHKNFSIYENHFSNNNICADNEQKLLFLKNVWKVRHLGKHSQNFRIFWLLPLDLLGSKEGKKFTGKLCFSVIFRTFLAKFEYLRNKSF